ncbi:MAG: hypothetical protein QM767_18230 [Anaeromyxobacter sp.]
MAEASAVHRSPSAAARAQTRSSSQGGAARPGSARWSVARSVEAEAVLAGRAQDGAAGGGQRECGGEQSLRSVHARRP